MPVRAAPVANRRRPNRRRSGRSLLLEALLLIGFFVLITQVILPWAAASLAEEYQGIIASMRPSGST